MENDKKDAALEFLRSNELGVLATISSDGKPHARTVYYSADDDFSIHFLTYSNTRKAADLRKNPNAAFVITDPDAPSTMQIEGMVTDETETATLGPAMDRLLDVLRAKGDHFAPLTRMDPAAIRYYKLTPAWVRWGDFRIGEHSDEVFTQIPA